MTLILALKKHKFLLLGVITFTILESLIAVIPAQIIGCTIDYLSDILGHSSGPTIQQKIPIVNILSGFIGNYTPPKMIMALALTYLVFSLINIIFGNFRGFLTTLLGEKCIMYLRQKIFSHIMLSNLSFLNSNKTGDLISRIINDTNEIRQIIISPVNGLITGIFTMLWAVYFSFKISLNLTFVMILPTPLIVWLGFYFGDRQKQVAKTSREALGKITANITNRLRGILTIKAFVKEFLEIERFNILLTEFLTLNIKGFKLTFWFWPTIGLVQASVVSVILFYGGKQVLSSVLTVGQISILIQYLFKIYDPLISISRFYNSVATALVSLKRVEDITRNNTIIEHDHPAATENVSINGKIEIINVDYAYNHNNYILKGISLAINPGEKLALIGASGSGKSTLLALLTGFYKPLSGSILLNNKPLSYYRLKDLRRNICLIPQEPIVFELSLAENLRFVKPEATDVELETIISKVKLEYLLKRGGLGLNLGDMGSQLSLGERQRIALARALLINPSVVLLDEPVSHVDTENEKNILNLIQELFVGKTVIIASHKLSVLSIVDKVFSLSESKFVDKNHFSINKNIVSY